MFSRYAEVSSHVNRNSTLLKSFLHCRFHRSLIWPSKENILFLQNALWALWNVSLALRQGFWWRKWSWNHLFSLQSRPFSLPRCNLSTFKSGWLGGRGQSMSKEEKIGGIKRGTESRGRMGEKKSRWYRLNCASLGTDKYLSIVCCQHLFKMSSGKDAASEQFTDFISNDLQNFEQKHYWLKTQKINFMPSWLNYSRE